MYSKAWEHKQTNNETKNKTQSAKQEYFTSNLTIRNGEEQARWPPFRGLCSSNGLDLELRVANIILPALASVTWRPAHGQANSRALDFPSPAHFSCLQKQSSQKSATRPPPLTPVNQVLESWIYSPKRKNKLSDIFNIKKCVRKKKSTPHSRVLCWKHSLCYYCPLISQWKNRPVSGD